MPRLRLLSFFFIKSGLYSLVYTGTMSRNSPPAVKSNCEHVRILMERRMYREASLGFLRCLKSDIKYLKNKFKQPKSRYFESEENKLIDLAENQFNIINHVRYVVSKRCPVFLDTTYLNGAMINELYNLTEIESNTPFLSFDVVVHMDDYLENNLNVTLRSCGVVVCINQKKDTLGAFDFNNAFGKLFVGELGASLHNAYLFVCDKSSIDFATLEYLVKNRKSKNLTIVPMLSLLGESPTAWEMERRSAFERIMRNL